MVHTLLQLEADRALQTEDTLPRQQFVVTIQAAIGTKVIARETLSAYRKDVTAGLYGGHYERKVRKPQKMR